MIQKPRHAPGGVGLFNSRLGVSRWMHTLFCSGQALQEMQKDELAPGVAPDGTSTLDSEIALRTENWLMSSPDPKARFVERARHGPVENACESIFYNCNTAISVTREVHQSTWPGCQDPHSNSRNSNLTLSTDHRVRYGPRSARESRRKCNRHWGGLGSEVSEPGAIKGHLLSRRQRVSKHLKHEEDECLLMIEGIEILKKRLKEEMAHLQHTLERTCKERDENESLLKFHEVLKNSNDLESAVRAVKEKALAEVPEDLQVMVNDCLESRHGLRNKACVVCMEDFTAEDLLKVSKSDKCRHAIYPCGHAVLCGGCAKSLWSTTRKCPLCRTEMKKKPTVFKPGRWQAIDDC